MNFASMMISEGWCRRPLQCNISNIYNIYYKYYIRNVCNFEHKITV